MTMSHDVRIHLSHDHSHNPELKELAAKTQLTETFVRISCFSRATSLARTLENVRRVSPMWIDQRVLRLQWFFSLRYSRIVIAWNFILARYKRSLFFRSRCKHAKIYIWRFTSLRFGSEIDRYQSRFGIQQFSRCSKLLSDNRTRPKTKWESLWTRRFASRTCPCCPVRRGPALNSFVESSSFHSRQSGLHKAEQ